MKPLLAAFCATAVCAGAAHAAEPVTVDTVIVTGAPNPDDPPVVAQARERLSQTPGAVSVISAESYSKRQSLALDDVLRDAPGVYAQRKWGGDIRISIRGSGIGNANHNRGLLIAQDGLPLNEADGYGDSQAVDPLIARYAEVYRGGNALRFGGALLGGAINMVTPTGRNAGFDARVRLDGGSFGLVREHVAVARAGAEWDGFAALTNQTAQGARPQSQQNLQFASLNVGRAFGEDRDVRLIVSGSDIRQEIPGALTAAQLAADPRQPAPGAYANDQARNQRNLRGTLQTHWRLNESTGFEGGVYVTWKDLDHPIFQVIDQQSRNYGAFGRFDWKGAVGGMKADAFGGLWLRSGDLDSNFYVNVKGARGAPTSVSLQNARGVDLFGEARLFVAPRLAVVGGATWGRAERDYQSFAVPGVPASFDLKASKDFDWFAPRLGLLWEGDDGVQVFANFTRSVEPPNFSALSPAGSGFAPIREQTAWTGEVGSRGHRGPWRWDVTYYRAEIESELLQYTVAAGIPATTFNADKTRHQGIEAALDWRVLSRLRLRQSYAWSDFRFDGDVQYADNRLPVVPEHFYRAELRYDDPRGWFVAPSVEWSASDLWVDFSNTARAPSYAVWNLNAGAPLTPAVSVFLDARNLTDEAYASNVQPVVLAAPATAAFWPGDGRALFGGVTWTF